MDESLYLEILASLKGLGDIPGLARRHGTPEAVLLMILNQKVVEETRGGRFYRVKANSAGLLERWEGGETLLDLARRADFSPVLLASFLLEEIGFGRKQIKRMMKNPDMVKDQRLRQELEAALGADHVYSPWAHRLQERRGAKGEGIIRDWLEEKGIRFKGEKDMGGGKTPDFVMESELLVDGSPITWIDSKASFGSPTEHRKNMKRQLRFYLEEFGPGMVVYWFGYVEGVGGDGVIVKDGDFFEGFEKDIEGLFRMTGVGR